MRFDCIHCRKATTKPQSVKGAFLRMLTQNLQLWQLLWFAFILVSLNHWKQLHTKEVFRTYVVICFHFSIFEPLETTTVFMVVFYDRLWFAFILVSLNHWKQPSNCYPWVRIVVICFHFSIFEPLETTFIAVVSVQN